MNKRKRLGFLMLVALGVLTLGTTAFAEEASMKDGFEVEEETVIEEKLASILDSGSCGENVTWTMYSDGRLVIDGSGYIEDYDGGTYSTKRPGWYSRKDDISEIIFSGSVNTIGKYAFQGLSNLTSITWPTTLQTIKTGAFQKCTSLDNITIPKTLIMAESNDVCKSVFEGCTSLKTVSFENGTVTIPEYIFLGVQSVQNVTMPDSVTTINDGAFSGTGITNLQFSDSIKFIKRYAFADCTKLATIKLSNNITELGKDAFRNCPVSSIVIPASLKTVGYGIVEGGPFQGSGLVSATIAEGSTAIPTGILFGCKKLENIVIPNSVKIIEDYALADTGLKTITLPLELKSIGEGAFSSNAYLETIVIPDSVKEVGVYAFTGCTMLRNVTLPRGTKTFRIAFSKCTGLEEVFIPNTVNYANSMFADCSSLRKVILEEGIKEVSTQMFYGCNNLLEIYIPASVTTIVGLPNTKIVTIYGESGSYAEKYAKENGLDFKEGTRFETVGEEVRYIQNGIWNPNRTGYVNYAGGKFYIENGLLSKRSGLVNDGGTADWYYLANGAAQIQYTGLAEYDGAWFYVNQGKLNTELNAFVEYDGGMFFVGAGRIITEANGLAMDPAGSGKWYFLANGQVQNQYTGLALYDNHWFYVEKGRFRNDYTGNVVHNGATFHVVNGQLYN